MAGVAGFAIGFFMGAGIIICCALCAADKRKSRWIPVEERIPETDDHVLLSFMNFSLPAIGRYEQHKDGSGSWYLGDCDGEDTCNANDLFVNAWMPLPEVYREEEHE